VASFSKRPKAEEPMVELIPNKLPEVLLGAPKVPVFAGEPNENAEPVGAGSERDPKAPVVVTVLRGCFGEEGQVDAAGAGAAKLAHRRISTCSGIQPAIALASIRSAKM
jgi:hypothetical protein